MKKAYGLPILIVGILVCTGLDVALTQSAWPLINLILVPLALFVWKYDKKGLVEMNADADDEIVVTVQTPEVILETAKGEDGDWYTAGGNIGSRYRH